MTIYVASSHSYESQIRFSGTTEEAFDFARPSHLLDEHVQFACERVRSGAANATPKLTSIIAGMAAGPDSIDDLDDVRTGGMKCLFGRVYDASTLGILLCVHPRAHPATVGGAAAAKPWQSC